MKNTQSQTKSVRFSFRMTAEEQRLLAETAEKLNVKPSDVARFAINAASIATNNTLQAA
jgi:uncharacterized protein (DUF1778 family)